VKELVGQMHRGTIVPFSTEDKEVLDNYKENQIVNLKISGTTKGRALEQLRLYWAACDFFAGYSEHENFNAKEKVDFQLRNKLQFYDMSLVFVNNGVVTFNIRSISFKNLEHIEACQYFGKAFEIMANSLGVTVDAFIEEVKSNIGGRA